MHQHNDQPENEIMIDRGHPKKRYIFASDFDQTLSFNDSGYVLAELLGIPEAEFERKATGMAKLNLVQQGGELAYLLLHDPEFRSKVRPEHLYEAGKRVRLKPNIDLLYRFLSEEVEDFHFDFYVISAGPVEVIRSALEGHHPCRSHLRHGIRIQREGRNRKNSPGDSRLRKGGRHRQVAG